jgi:hypothetical protein
MIMALGLFLGVGEFCVLSFRFYEEVFAMQIGF